MIGPIIFPSFIFNSGAGSVYQRILIDPCPNCNGADLEPFGGKHRCPQCGYIQPCCDGGKC